MSTQGRHLCTAQSHFRQCNRLLQGLEQLLFRQGRLCGKCVVAARLIWSDTGIFLYGRSRGMPSCFQYQVFLQIMYFISLYTWARQIHLSPNLLLSQHLGADLITNFKYGILQELRLAITIYCDFIFTILFHFYYFFNTGSWEKVNSHTSMDLLCPTIQTDAVQMFDFQRVCSQMS